MFNSIVLTQILQLVQFSRNGPSKLIGSQLEKDQTAKVPNRRTQRPSQLIVIQIKLDDACESKNGFGDRAGELIEIQI